MVFPTMSAEVYQRLLQKISVLEMELHQLRLNVEANTQCNLQDVTQRSWNTLGAKPKATRITGRTRTPEISDETGWPALPSRQAEGISSSTPVQLWKTAKGRNTNKPPETISVQLGNRFTPLPVDPSDKNIVDSPSDGTVPSSPSRVRSKTNSENKHMPEILIVGDAAVKDVKNIKRKAKVLCFPKDTVSDMNDRILDLVDSHPTVKTLILQIGTNDTEGSEIIKEHFTALFSTLSSLDVNLCILGPLPQTRGSDERFSRLSGLNKWLSTTCANESVHFIDNFNFFWDRRHLFAANGIHLNKKGVKLYISNIFYSLCDLPSKARTPKYITIDSAEITTLAAVEMGEANAPTTEDGGADSKTSELADSGVMEFTTTGPVLKTMQPPAVLAQMEETGKDDENGESYTEKSNMAEAEMVPLENIEDIEDRAAPPSSMTDEDDSETSSTASMTDEDDSLPSSPSFSSLSMSPIQLLEFTSDMNDLISVGTKLTPLKCPGAGISAGTKLTPLKGPKRQAPEPPTLKRLCPARPPLPRRHRKNTLLAPQQTQLENTFDN